eukprot:638297-Alexandrium_andersonii.AAC.1
MPEAQEAVAWPGWWPIPVAWESPSRAIPAHSPAAVPCTGGPSMPGQVPWPPMPDSPPMPLPHA